MRRFEFQASVAREGELRRWQKRVPPANIFSFVLSGGVGWILLGLAGLYVYDAYLNYHSRFGKATALIDGCPLTARNIILILDNSRSMEGTEGTVKQLRDQLQATGISIGAEEKSQGFGFSTTGPDDNALHTLEQALRNNPSADAIYLFSDFDPTSTPYLPDAENTPGYSRLQELLRQGRRRLYLGTVRMPPPSELVRIARESGGDLIQNK